jgi:hypothetical protein
VVAELQAMTAPHVPVLLCWERPPFSAVDDWRRQPGEHDQRNLCHRRIVSVWLRDELGLEVPEVDEHVVALRLHNTP